LCIRSTRLETQPRTCLVVKRRPAPKNANALMTAPTGPSTIKTTDTANRNRNRPVSAAGCLLVRALVVHCGNHWRNMNFNGQDLYQLVNHSRQSTLARQNLDIMAPVDHLTTSFDANLGPQGDGTRAQPVPFKVLPSRRLFANLLGRRTVVRGGLSLALALALLFFSTVCFLCMIGPQNIRVRSLKIDQGQFSDNRSIHLLRNVP
jgi:hypothetical protein